MSSIHFIGGEKGGVGKSVVSRLLSQYFLDHKLLYAGIDADQSHRTLSRFYPEFTESIRLDDFESADRIVETALADEINVVIDLPAQSERFLNQWMEDGDVASLCEESGIRGIYWYVVDDGIDSARLATAFLQRHADQMPCVLVKNHGRGQDFSALDNALGHADKQPAFSVELPALHTGTMRKIDTLNLSFWGAVHAEQTVGKLALMERQRSRVWLRKAYAQIAEVIDATRSR